MARFHSLATRFFDKVILHRPGLVIICLLVVVAFLGYKAKDFRLDASAETLVLENDEDLRYSRLIKSRYGTQGYLFLTYTPKDDLFSDKVLANLTLGKPDATAG
jgi:predicted RND superfamily exporter protein